MSERKHMLRGHSVAIDAWSQLWMYHIRRSLLPGMTSIPFIFSLIGLGVLAYRRSRADLWVVGCLLLFLLPAEWVKAKPAPQPERYMIPCLPFLALMASCILQEAVVYARRWAGRLAALAVMLALILSPTFDTARLVDDIRPDTRERLGKWMDENLPDGSRVLVDWVPYAPLPTKPTITLEMFDPGRLIPEVADITTGKIKPNYDYLALSGLLYNRYFNQPFGVPARREVIKAAFEKLPIVKDETPRFRTYGFHNPAVTLFSLRPEDRAALERGEFPQITIPESRWKTESELEAFVRRALKVG